MELALVQAERRGGTLALVPSQGEPLWSCHRQHRFALAAKAVAAGRWCEECTESLGEVAIRKHLEELGLDYRCEATFPSLVAKEQLRVDFYVPSLRLFIEADGEQHFGSARCFRGSVLQRLEHDAIKDGWAKEGSFAVLRIPYWELALDREAHRRSRRAHREGRDMHLRMCAGLRRVEHRGA